MTAAQRLMLLLRPAPAPQLHMDEHGIGLRKLCRGFVPIASDCTSVGGRTPICAKKLHVNWWQSKGGVNVP